MSRITAYSTLEPHAFNQQSTPNQYSILEVQGYDQQAPALNRQGFHDRLSQQERFLRQDHGGLELNRPDPTTTDTHKEASSVPQSIQPDPVPINTSAINNKSPNAFAKKSCFPNRQRLRKVVCIFIIVLIAGAIGGAVGGTWHKRTHGNLPSGEGSSPQDPSKIILKTTRLTSLAWWDNDEVSHYRLFYQTNDLMIRQSSWNSSTPQWTHAGEAIDKAKKGSPLACSVQLVGGGVRSTHP